MMKFKCDYCNRYIEMEENIDIAKFIEENRWGQYGEKLACRMCNRKLMTDAMSIEEMAEFIWPGPFTATRLSDYKTELIIQLIEGTKTLRDAIRQGLSHDYIRQCMLTDHGAKIEKVLLSQKECIRKWAEENCEFGNEDLYAVGREVLRNAYNNSTPNVDVGIEEFEEAMSIFRININALGCYFGIRLRTSAVDELAQQLAQPWPEHVTSMSYFIDDCSVSISCNKDEYYWEIIDNSSGFEFEDTAPTLQEAARAVAEIIVSARQRRQHDAHLRAAECMEANH